MMQEVVITGIGDLGKLDTREVNKPEIKVGEVLIKVAYCGVNHLDLLIREGKRPGPTGFPHVLGSEIVGETEAGVAVAVYPWIFDNTCHFCLEGEQNLCDNSGTIGRTRDGGYAEYVAVPQINLRPIPKGVDLKDAASVVLAGTTAVHLVETAQIKDKSRVLVTGASGGVGAAVIQLLKARNCEIIAASSSPEKKDQLLEMGVSQVVGTDDLPKGMPYVIDIVGGKVLSAGIEALAKTGTLVYCSTSLPGLVEFDPQKGFAMEKKILGSNGGRVEDMVKVLNYVRDGIIKPVIDEILPLKRAAEAHQRLQDKKVFGKILLKP